MPFADPILSIIIPCYNHGLYLREALNSIEECKKKYAVEVIIMNDGSTDENTKQVLQEVEKEGYTVLNQANQGLAKARNNAIKLSKGKYILPLDSDNKVHEPYLNKAIWILEENPEYSIVYSDTNKFGEEQGMWKRGPFNLQKLMFSNQIDACAVYRREVWEDLGGYDDKMPVMGYEDWDFWLRASFKGYKFFYLEEIGFEYRVLGTSMIKSVTQQKSAAVMDYLLDKHRSYLGTDYVEQWVIGRLKSSKSALIKLNLAVIFPSFLRLLKKAGIIKTKKVF